MPSSTPGPSGPDETWLARVGALLAKAESTEFPEEAEALLAKAQSLMARHAIDEAMLSSVGRRRRDPVGTATIAVTAPYASAKASLLGAVAHANRCRAVFGPSPDSDRTCIVVGHETDLATVRSLFTALSAHAVTVMVRTEVPAGDTVRRFRHAFLLAFAGRIGQRLREAQRHEERDAVRTGGSSVTVVLADRMRAVDAAFAAAFPMTRAARSSSSSAAGHRSGRRAADGAGLGGPGLTGARRALGSGPDR